MGGDSIARGVRVALVGLTVTLLAVVALGIAGLYGARTAYEEALVSTYELETAAGELRAAGVVEQAAIVTAPVGSSPAVSRARRVFERQAQMVRGLAADDPESLRLVTERRALQDRVRDLGPADGAAAATVRQQLRSSVASEARALTDALIERQVERRAEARAEATATTRAAALTVVGAALLALLAALLLVRDFMRRVRRPLDQLVAATSRLARGDLTEGVPTTGPRELRELTDAFNVMAADLRVARKRLEDERTKLEVTIASLGDGLVVCDASGRVVDFNPRAAVLLAGLREGHPLDPDGGMLPSLEDAIDGEVVTESRGRTLAVTAAPLETDAGGTVWTVRDASERVRLERMKSDFVAAASHELRTPLTSIKGFAELLDCSEGLSAKHRDAIDVIRLSTERLVSLVDELLEVARLEAGRVQVESEPVRVQDVVAEVARMLAARIADRGQELEVVAPDELPPACGDARRIRDIVENLLTNAHLYTDEDGRIEVSCGSRSGAIAIAVSDTGRGLTPEELEHAFDRFYRGRHADAEVRGTGLGLWIVRSLAGLQGGSVTVESEIGRGSTFTVLLPRAEDEAPPREREPAAAGNPARGS